MAKLRLRVKENIDLNNFCSGWKELEDGFILTVPMSNKFVSVIKSDRTIINKGFTTTIHKWLINDLIEVI